MARTTARKKTPRPVKAIPDPPREMPERAQAFYAQAAGAH